MGRLLYLVVQDLSHALPFESKEDTDKRQTASVNPAALQILQIESSGKGEQ